MSTPRPRFDTERARAASARLRYNEIRDALSGLRVRAESRDRSISIDLGVGGAILGIELTGDAVRNTPDALSRMLLETINTGVREIAAITSDVVAPFLSGADLDLAAITSGRLPNDLAPPAPNEFGQEIEDASAIPKRANGVVRIAQASAGGT